MWCLQNSKKQGMCWAAIGNFVISCKHVMRCTKKSHGLKQHILSDSISSSTNINCSSKRMYRYQFMNALAYPSDKIFTFCLQIRHAAKAISLILNHRSACHAQKILISQKVTVFVFIVYSLKVICLQWCTA